MNGPESAQPSAAAPEPADDSTGPATVQSVDRALGLLAAVAAAAPRGLTVAELAADCGLNRATAWRLLGTLETHRLVERDPSSNRYRIGFALIRMSAAAGYDGLVRRTHPILQSVCTETGETADLAVAGVHGVTYVGEVTPTSVLSVSWLAREVPLHATSTGKAFLAWLPEREVLGLLRQPLQRFTATTVTDLDRLMAELDETRTRGFAVCAGELEPTLYGVSAPVLDDPGGRPMAVFSIWGPADRVAADRFSELGPVAIRAAAEVAAVMGG